jgi:hypothetical protein
LFAEAVSHDLCSIGTRLLIDCRTIFGDRPAVSTHELLRTLNADEEAPWRDYSSAGLTAAKRRALACRRTPPTQNP